MIANPAIMAYRYDPYDQRITLEKYDHSEMLKNRKEAIEKAKVAKMFGVILGTLGRQGNLAVLNFIEKKLDSLKKQYITILTSEIFPDKLKLFEDVDAFIQVSK